MTTARVLALFNVGICYTKTTYTVCYEDTNAKIISILINPKTSLASQMGGFSMFLCLVISIIGMYLDFRLMVLTKEAF